jgi:Bacterial membrane protein YfhO
LALALWLVDFGPLFHGLVQAGKDLSGHDFPETWYLLRRWRAGELPLWLPHARLGQPFLALLYVQALYPPRVLTGLLFGHVLGPNVLHALHAAWAFGGCYLAGRRLGLVRPAAFVAAAPLTLSPFFVELALDLSFASTVAWAGWVLLAALRLRAHPGLASAAWLALALGGAFHAGAPEPWLWEATFALTCAGSRRGLGWALLGLAWGLALGAVVGLPAAELAREAGAGAAPGALEWSLAPAQLLALAVPGGDLPRVGPYWGGEDQRFLAGLFLGAAPALLALVGARRRRLWPVLAVGAACGLLGLGRHFAPAAWVLALPPFSLFRYPVKLAVGGFFALSLLAGAGAQRLAALRRLSPLAFRAAAAALLGAAGGVWLAAELGPAREGLRHGAPWLPALAAAVALVGRRPGLTAALVALELAVAPVSRGAWVELAPQLEPSALGAGLRAEDAGRVSVRVDFDDEAPRACGPWDLPGAGEALVRDGRRRLSGLRFIEADLRAPGGYGFREPWRLQRAFRVGAAAFALASVSRFVRNTSSSPGFPGPTPELLPGLDEVWLWRWGGARPRGWVASRVRVATDAEAFAELGQPRPDFEALVDAGPARDGGCASAPVRTEEQTPELVVQEVDACAAGVVILADAWFPGWTVEVDGERVEPRRAFGFLRAAPVSAGRHRVVWRYQPASFRLGAAVTALGLAGVAAALVRRRRPAAGFSADARS